MSYNNSSNKSTTHLNHGNNITNGCDFYEREIDQHLNDYFDEAGRAGLAGEIHLIHELVIPYQDIQAIIFSLFGFAIFYRSFKGCWRIVENKVKN